MATKKQAENTRGKSTAKQKSNAGKIGDEKSAAKSSLKSREAESLAPEAQGEKAVAKQPTRKLNEKQLKYVEAVIATGNGRKAAIEAGYSPESAKTIAAQNKAKPRVSQRIAERLESLTSWTANEGLGALVEYSRGDMSQFFNDDGSFIGITNVQLRGLGHLIKSIEFKRTLGPDDSPVEIVKFQLYDAMEAQKSLLSYVTKPLKRSKEDERTRLFYETMVAELATKHGVPREQIVQLIVERRPEASKYLLPEE